MVKKAHYPLLSLLAALLISVPLLAVEYEASIGEDAPDGTSPAIDFPKVLRKKNIGSPRPRFIGDPKSWGCCVFRSIDHAAHWQNLPQLNGFPEWMVEKGIQGGGYPAKVDDLLPKICADRNSEVPGYIQVENNNLEILKLACKTGRMVCVTYSYSPTGRYNSQRISHMVNLVHADDKWFAVLDNNYIETLEWMSPEEFLPVYHGGRRNGWAIIFLSPPPPPVPRNKNV